MRTILEENIANSNTFDKTRLVYLLLLCAVQFLLGIFYLGSVPRIYMDEAWDASLGYEFAQTGILRHPFVHNFGGMEVHFVQPRVILPIICAGIFKVTGYSIAISRLPSLLMSILAIIALYYVAEQFFGNKQSFFICIAAIINPWFWVDSRRCRPEMCYTALALVFLWLMISYFRRDRALVAFFAGITAGLASLTHPNGLLLVAAAFISWILWKEKPYLLKFAIWVLAGFVLTILPYAIYIFYASRNSNVSFLEQIHIAPSYTSVMGREILRWRSFLQLPFGIPVALIMFAGWLTAWWKATAEDKFIATITAVYPLSLIFCGTNALPDYLVAIIPCISILVVRFIYRLHEVDFFKGSRRIHYLVRLVVILIYITSSLPPTLFILYQQHNDDFNKVIDEIANVVGPKARVYGDPVFWVGHDRYIYGPYPINGYVITIKEGLQWVYLQSFDYVIRTTWDNSRPSQGFKRIPNKMPNFRIELLGDNICKLFGTKVYEFYNEYYGPVEIYKLDWSNAWKYRLEKRKIE